MGSCEGDEDEDESAPENSGGALVPVSKLRRRGRGLLVGVKDPRSSGSFVDSRGCAGALFWVRTVASMDGRRGRGRELRSVPEEEAARVRRCRRASRSTVDLDSLITEVDWVRVWLGARSGNGTSTFSPAICCSCRFTFGASVEPTRDDEVWGWGFMAGGAAI